MEWKKTRASFSMRCLLWGWWVQQGTERLSKACHECSLGKMMLRALFCRPIDSVWSFWHLLSNYWYQTGQLGARNLKLAILLTDRNVDCRSSSSACEFQEKSASINSQEFNRADLFSVTGWALEWQFCHNSSAPVAAANRTCSAAAQRGCVGRHRANTNELRVSGSDSYAFLFLLGRPER